MIYSSSDILRILGADLLIREEARLSVVNGRPGLDAGEHVYIYIDEYPSTTEFEATWKIWVRDNTGTNAGELVGEALARLLPALSGQDGEYSTTDFKSTKTVTKTRAAIELEETRAERERLRATVKGLQDGLEERLGGVRSGVDGRDGKDGLDGAPGRDGADGRDGRDGRDIDATETELFDLKDVGQSPIPLQKGQVLMWDGSQWTNLYVPQVTSLFTGTANNGSQVSGQVNSDTITSDTAPTEREDGKGPLRDGDTWWKSDTGEFFVYYVDGDNGQWVEVEGDPSSSIRVLDDLEDVEAATAADQQVIAYEAATQMWKPRSLGSLTIEQELNDLTDVDTTGKQDEQVLSYEASTSTWKPRTINSTPPPQAINDLIDVDTAGAISGDALLYDGANWKAGGDMSGGNF